MDRHDIGVIDLNADLGEGAGDAARRVDAQLLDVVTSANVACGVHAGDAAIMRRTCDEAAARGVVVGAHVSYADREGFGRREVEVSADDLVDQLLEQIGALDAIGRSAGTAVGYVKAHGALYNRCAFDDEHSGALVRALQSQPRPLALLAAPGSAAVRLARAAGLSIVTEGFVDRAYEADGTLVARTKPNAVHATAGAAVAQAVEIARDRQVTSSSGERIALDVASLCVHGDTPHAVDVARAVRLGLLDAGIGLRAFL